MKRSSFKRSGSTPHWRRPRKAKLLVPKRLGLSTVSTGPIRDRAHLTRVAQHPCLVCRSVLVHAHHIRECFPRTMGVRIGDDRTAPLCTLHHDELHMHNTDAFWKRHGIDAVTWTADFYAQTLEIRRRMIAPSDRGK